MTSPEEEFEEIKGWFLNEMKVDVGMDYHVIITHDDWDRIVHYLDVLIKTLQGRQDEAEKMKGEIEEENPYLLHGEELERAVQAKREGKG